MQEPINSDGNVTSKSVTVSVVSHGYLYDHWHENRYAQRLTNLVRQLLRDKCVKSVILTLKTTDEIDLPTDDHLMVFTNSLADGQLANYKQALHNKAFDHCQTPYFCVISPDSVLRENSLSSLTSELVANKAAVAGPLVISRMGDPEITWGRFPTLTKSVLKAFGNDTIPFTPPANQSTFYPDWISSICMLFQSEGFREVGGFDERMTPYFADADICARLWKRGYRVLATKNATIIEQHDGAQNPHWSHIRGHFESFAKFLVRHSFGLPRAGNRQISRNT